MTVSLTVDTSNIVDGQNIDAADVTTPISQLKTSLEDALNGIQAFDRQSFGAPEALTISALGVITVTKTNVVVDTFASASTDDLDTISGGANGRILYLRCASNSRNVVIRHGVGNIRTANGSNYVLNSTDLFVYLVHNGTNWLAVLTAQNQFLNLGGFGPTTTINGDAIARTRVMHFLVPESGTSDDLRTISGGVAGDVIVIAPASGSTSVIRVRHKALAGGNIALSDQRDRWLVQQEDMLALLFNGSYWCELSKEAPSTGLLYQNSWFERASAATFESVGVAAGTNGGAGALTNANDTEDIYVSQAIAATAGTIGGRRTTTFNLVRRAYNPIFEAVIKTPADITNMRFWVGMFGAAPTNVDTLATHGIVFRYSTVAADAGWMAVCNDGSIQSTPSFVSSIAANTRYTFRIRVDDTGSAWFSVNEGGEVQAFTNLPASALDMGAGCIGITTTASAKSMIVGRYGVRWPGIR
jgi:hypothetical protein